MVRYDVFVIGEGLVTNATFRVLLHDLAIQELPHLCRRPKFPIAAWMVWIFDAFDSDPRLAPLPNLFSAATEERFMNRTELLAAKFHWFLEELDLPIRK
jgi:hypothetical protein